MDQSKDQHKYKIAAPLGCLEVYRDVGLKVQGSLHPCPAVSSVRVFVQGRVGRMYLNRRRESKGIWPSYFRWVKFRGMGSSRKCGKISMMFGTS